jgi:predicted hotdog family 3-hydroxylacyl-ACP dehydratase
MLPISGDNLTALIPQKHPFVLISSLKEVNEKTCLTTFAFSAAHVLCDKGQLSAAGLLENMAQSAGCKIGYDDFLNGKKHAVGFIGEVRDFFFTRLPYAGEELTTEINIEHKVFGTVTVMTGRIMVGEEEIAACKMKVFFEGEKEES